MTDREEEDFENNKELCHEGNVRCGLVLLLFLKEMILLVASIKACAKPSIRACVMSPAFRKARLCSGLSSVASFCSAYIGSK